jgi:hypothetical protein
LTAAKGIKTIPIWLSYLDLASAAVAGALWCALPQLGSWPLVLALLPWGLRVALTGRLTRTTRFDLLLVLFLLLSGLAVWTSYDRQTALAKFWLILGGVLLYYALVNAEGLGNGRAWLLALFGAGVAVYFVLSHDWSTAPPKFEALARLGQALQAFLPAVPGNGLHPNVAGGIMAAMLPFAGLAAIHAGKMVQQGGGQPAGRWLGLILALALCGAIGLGLLLSSSRGAWLALGVALALGTALYIARSVFHWLGHHRPALQRWVRLGLVMVLLVMALAFALAWPGGIWTALGNLPGPNTAAPRAEMQGRSLVLVHDYAVLGAGLDSFMMLYSTYALLTHVGYIQYSHNLFLDVAIEQGLPSLLMLVLSWLLFAVAVWRMLWRSPESQGRPQGESSSPDGGGLLAAAGLSLVVTLVHGMGDDVYYASWAVLLLFLPLAFAVPFLAPAGQPSAGRRGWRWVLALAAGLGLLLALVLVWRKPLLSLVHSNLGTVQQSRAELSQYTWPEWPIQDALRREIDLGRPLAEFERALTLDPGNASASRRLGQIELSLAEYEEALAHLEVAYAAESWSPTTRQLYGEALIVNGFVAEGQALWATLASEEGQLQARTFWYEYIGDEERAAWIRQAASSR